MAALFIIDLAMVGEPEAAVRVEHDVVGAAQDHAVVARLVEDFDRARRDVDPLDPPARIVARDPVRRQIAVRLDIMEPAVVARSEEHTSELQSLMRISYAVFCLKKNIQSMTITQ